MSNQLTSNDLPTGRRAIIQQQKLLTRYLDDTIRYNTSDKFTLEQLRPFVMDIAAGALSYRGACMKYGISYNTLNEWKRKGWIQEAVEIAKDLVQEQLDRKLSGVVHQALNNISTALEKGDGYIGKDGTLKHKPVTAKDNAVIAAIAFDKQRLLRGEATTISENRDDGEMLKELADRFKSFATREEKVIDGELVRGVDE